MASNGILPKIEKIEYLKNLKWKTTLNSKISIFQQPLVGSFPNSKLMTKLNSNVQNSSNEQNLHCKITSNGRILKIGKFVKNGRQPQFCQKRRRSQIFQKLKTTLISARALLPHTWHPPLGSHQR